MMETKRRATAAIVGELLGLNVGEADRLLRIIRTEGTQAETRINQEVIRSLGAHTPDQLAQYEMAHALDRIEDKADAAVERVKIMEQKHDEQMSGKAVECRALTLAKASTRLRFAVLNTKASFYSAIIAFITSVVMGWVMWRLTNEK